MGGGSAKRWTKAALTGGIGEVLKNDTVRGMMGKETKAEKSAREEQQSALASAKAEADMSLEERRKRMELKKSGRGSLLSGAEAGVATTSTLG